MLLPFNFKLDAGMQAVQSREKAVEVTIFRPDGKNVIHISKPNQARWGNLLEKLAFKIFHENIRQNR